MLRRLLREPILSNPRDQTVPPVSAHRISLSRRYVSNFLSRYSYNTCVERQFPQGRYVKHDDDHFTISIDESADKVWWITTDPLCIPSSSPCQPIVVDLHPGETLYLPSLWYHQVSSIDDVTDGTVISVNFWYDLAYEAPQYALFNHFRQSVLLVGDEGMVRRDRH